MKRFRVARRLSKTVGRMMNGSYATQRSIKLSTAVVNCVSLFMGMVNINTQLISDFLVHTCGVEIAKPLLGSKKPRAASGNCQVDIR
ncbi:hypothetical protein P5673_005993 [Acropora cervicornis]|uniref:Uncharacterized protein n=1 Tax=Acropora cervicornis TaxID=6130 RepID=A0AAD9QX33_ACRCE|nr:hypothetical protein P5673_005993 [Acropora cervicornis]